MIFGHEGGAPVSCGEESKYQESKFNTIVLFFCIHTATAIKVVVNGIWNSNILIWEKNI